MSNMPPTGTLTFLFTDIEGTTRLWQAAPDAMQAALARRRMICQLAHLSLPQAFPPLRSYTICNKLHGDPRWRPYLGKIGLAD